MQADFFELLIERIRHGILDSVDDFDIPDPILRGQANELFSVINSNYIEKNWAEKRIDIFNNTLLEYAQHNYTASINYSGEEEIFDSTAVAINCLGEELNHSTVTRDFLEDIFNSLDDMMIVVNLDGEIIFINDYALDKLGYDRDEILKSNIFILLPNEINFLDAINKKPFDPNNVLLRKEGDLIQVSIKISSYVRGDNEIVGAVIIAHDVSELVKYKSENELQNKEIKDINRILSYKNAELYKAKIKAEESDKLKSSFLANISHEIRTPMNSIIGFSDLLSNNDNDKESQKTFIEIIKTNSNQLLSIINDIIDISKIESGLLHINESPVDINLFISEIVNSFSQTDKIRSGDIELTLIVPNDLNALIDRTKVFQILNNLINNALKFTDKGKIEVEWVLQRDKYLMFSVKDTGIGISEENKKTVFNRFKQINEGLGRKYGGNGLGLSISKGLVELHGGSIWFESKLGVGSAFYFQIPYKTISRFSEKTLKEEISKSTYTWNEKTVLVVEDNPLNMLLFESALKKTFINILKAETGNEAIEITRKNPSIDIILMDIQLPDITGLEATEKIRTFNTKVVVIAQTANVLSDAIKENSINAGCDDFVSKPIKMDYLFSMMDYYFEN
ncbi:MAG: ATP-binding protein [Bacteroidota bacterium]